MSSKVLSAFLGLSLISTFLFSNSALAYRAEDAIKYRQSIFTALRWHFGAMGAMVRGKAEYDADQFSHHATQLAALTRMPKEGFIEGSDFGDTDAKDELWRNLADVNQRFDQLAADADRLLAVSGGSLDDIRGPFNAIGKSCKGCHDKYRID